MDRPSPGESSFDVVDLIRQKRDGSTLSDDAIDWLIDAYGKGSIADEQMSALLMAIFFRGMSREELAAVDARR